MKQTGFQLVPNQKKNHHNEVVFLSNWKVIRTLYVCRICQDFFPAEKKSFPVQLSPGIAGRFYASFCQAGKIKNYIECFEKYNKNRMLQALLNPSVQQTVYRSVRGGVSVAPQHDNMIAETRQFLSDSCTPDRIVVFPSLYFSQSGRLDYTSRMELLSQAVTFYLLRLSVTKQGPQSRLLIVNPSVLHCHYMI